MTIDQQNIVDFLASSLRDMIDMSKAGAPTVRVSRNIIELAPACRAGRCLEVREDLSIRVDGVGVAQGTQWEAALDLWTVTRNWVGAAFMPEPIV